MLVRTWGASLVGIGGVAVAVEVDAGRGLPSFHIVGSGDRVVAEGRDRIRAAFRQSGLEFPPGRVTVNLAPGERPKSGSALDLAIAVAIAATQVEIPASALGTHLLVGELALDGRLRGVRGALALLEAACALGGSSSALPHALVPLENAAEARLAESVNVLAAPDLVAVLSHLRGQTQLQRAEPPPAGSFQPSTTLDLADVHGQDSAKRALEVAAAGGHHLLLIGPPGTGKTMLAQRMPGLLPELTAAASLEVTRIHGVAGRLAAEVPVRTPPLRAPHHTASAAGLIGGGRPLRPGEISLAHRGVLFLDELPEFRRSALEALRQPLEHGCVLVARAHGWISLPARFQLAAAMNPCPCGYHGDPARECTCDPVLVQRYRDRLSGPLLDRIDLHVPVPLQRVPAPWRSASIPGQSEAVRWRVHAARERQLARWPDAVSPCNAALPHAALRDTCRPDAAGERLLERATERLGLSMRAQASILRIARTIADLAGSERIGPAALAEAIGYRWLDRGAAAATRRQQ